MLDFVAQRIVFSADDGGAGYISEIGCGERTGEWIGAIGAFREILVFEPAHHVRGQQIAVAHRFV
jgi:hypothetical protein